MFFGPEPPSQRKVNFLSNAISEHFVGRVSGLPSEKYRPPRSLQIKPPVFLLHGRVLEALESNIFHMLSPLLQWHLFGNLAEERTESSQNLRGEEQVLLRSSTFPQSHSHFLLALVFSPSLGPKVMAEEGGSPLEHPPDDNWERGKKTEVVVGEFGEGKRSHEEKAERGQAVPPYNDSDEESGGEGGVSERDEAAAVKDASPCPTYKDMATWTVEDDMPSPMDSSTPMDSPDLTQLRRFKHYRQEGSEAMPLPPHPYLNSPDDHTEESVLTLVTQVPPSSSTCFTVSSQLQSREARLYENVPTPTSSSKSGIELGLIFTPPIQHTTQASPHGERETLNHNEFLSVSDFLNNSGNGFGGPPSRSSWVDSGRESLSFDGESGNTPNNSNSNNSNSSRTVTAGSGSNYYYQHPTHDFSPSHVTPYASKLRNNGEGRMSRRERLTRQKHAIDESFSFQFQPITNSPTGTSSGNGVHSMCSYLAVPSPRRNVLSSGITSTSALAAVSPISLHRHPNSQQLLLQENKKSRGLIPCESPYAFNSTERDQRKAQQHYVHHTDGHGGSFNDHVNNRLHRLARSPSRGHTTSTGKYKVQHSSGCARYKNESFDYGELPSHQMFPKRHLLPNRQYSQPYSGGNNCGLSSTAAHIPPHQPQLHRSFPANLLSGVAPRSCSMGDLSSGVGAASPGSLNGKLPHGEGGEEFVHHVTIPTTNPTQSSSAMTSNGAHPLVASLPLPPATSVTYEFSLAPVSGTLAPGWHLTAVQRGLATAVPLAAVVARRRLPRPRPIRPRFGFTDKNEARRAKCTIVVTALALLAMSMLLVGITLRLAPLIDDLERIDIKMAKVNWRDMSVAYTEDEIKAILETCRGLPHSQGDKLSTLDILDILIAMRYKRSIEQITEYRKYFDKHFGGNITSDSLVDILRAVHKASLHAAWHAKQSDTNNDGIISKSEFEHILGLMSVQWPGVAGKTFDDFLREADVNDSSDVTIEECINWLGKYDSC